MPDSNNNILFCLFKNNACCTFGVAYNVIEKLFKSQQFLHFRSLQICLHSFKIQKVF